MQEDCLAPAPNVHGTTYKCSMGCDYDICQKCYDDLTVCVTIRWHKHPLTRHWMEGFQCDACLEAQHVHTRRPRSGRACRLRLEAPWHLGMVPPLLGPEQG